MRKKLKKIKRYVLALLGKDIYFPIQTKRSVEWHGNTGAGFYVCTDHLDANSIVYSFGVGEDISFDESLISKFNCNLFAFDPTPKSIQYIQNKTLPEKFHFNGYGLYNYDGRLKFYLPENPEYVSGSNYNRWNYDEVKTSPINVPVKRLSTIVHELRHKKIDLLKMDIEGSEYEIINDILNSTVEIDQLLIEFHHRFPGIGFGKTRHMIKRLNSSGYMIAAISESYEEFTFIRTGKKSNG